MDRETRARLIEWAQTYNDPAYFQEDPIAFPRRFAFLARRGEAGLRDVEAAAVIAAHLAWGRRAMIVRDCKRAFDEMGWKPYDYIMRGNWRSDPSSLHRTVKWSEFAAICSRMRAYYMENASLEHLSTEMIRTEIIGSREDRRAPNKKICMMRRWLVRDDGKVDLGLWKDTPADSLVIPLDVHVHTQACALGLTQRSQKDLATALEITDAFRDIFPSDPCKGDFALFGYGVTHQ